MGASFDALVGSGVSLAKVVHAQAIKNGVRDIFSILSSSSISIQVVVKLGK